MAGHRHMRPTLDDFRNVANQEIASITIPISHHHRQHLNQYNLSNRNHNIGPNSGHAKHIAKPPHSNYDPDTNNVVEPNTPAKKPTHHADNMIANNEIDDSFRRESATADENEENLGAAMTNEPLTGQVNKSFNFFCFKR